MDLICTITLIRSDVETGSTLKGHLRLLEDSSAAREAEKLQIRAICHIEGPGDPETRVLGTTELPGPFKAQVDLPFAVPIPEKGPLTYQGVTLHTRWILEAQLVVPDGWSPRREVPFRVLPARSSPRKRGTGRAAGSPH
jgi:hypothetical protein